MRFNSYVLFCSCAAALLLAACAGKPTPEAEQPKEETFGIWTFNPDSCRVYGQRADIFMSTDGTLSNDRLYVKVSSAVELGRTPYIKFNNLPFLPIKLEGTRNHFSFEIPYTPASTAKLIDEKSFAVVTYFPNGAVRARNAYFPTAGLPTALAKWAKFCGKPAKA